MNNFFLQQLTTYEIIWVFISVLLNMSALAVIFSQNPVISVFNMILSFLFGSMLVFLTGSDFLAFVYIIVYMGAIVVLFLFVVMMLQIKPTSFKMSLIYSPISILLGLILLAELVFVLDFSTFAFSNSILNSEWVLTINPSSNILVLGQLMYTYYFLFFLISGLILLVALVSAILLTLKYFKFSNVSSLNSSASSPVALRFLHYSLVGVSGTGSGSETTLVKIADGCLNAVMVLSYTALGLYFISAGLLLWASSWHHLAMTEAALHSRGQEFRKDYIHELYANYFTFLKQNDNFKIFKFPTQQSLAYMRDVVVSNFRHMTLAPVYDANSVSVLGVYDRYTNTGFHYQLSKEFFLIYRHNFYKLNKSMEYIKPYLNSLAKKYEEFAQWWMDKSIFFFESAVLCVKTCFVLLFAAIALKVVDKVIKSGIIIKVAVKVYKFFFAAAASTAASVSPAVQASFEKVKAELKSFLQRISEFFIPSEIVEDQIRSLNDFYKGILPYLHNFRPPSQLPSEFNPAREYILGQLLRSLKPVYPDTLPLVDSISKWIFETLSDPLLGQCLKVIIDFVRRFF